MNLEQEDIRRIIEWANAVEDLNHMYLEPEDRALLERLKEAISAHE